MLETMLGRMNSDMSEHFGTSENKELAATGSGSVHSLCQEAALQIVKCSPLNMTLISDSEECRVGKILSI